MGHLHWLSWMSSAYIVFYVFLLNKLENFLYFLSAILKITNKNNYYLFLLLVTTSLHWI